MKLRALVTYLHAVELGHSPRAIAKIMDIDPGTVRLRVRVTERWLATDPRAAEIVAELSVLWRAHNGFYPWRRRICDS